MDNNEEFFSTYRIPFVIVVEYNKRWGDVSIISFEEFYKLIRKDDDRDYWYDLDAIDSAYQNYKTGVLWARYPAGLPKHPVDIWNELMEDVEILLKF